MDRSTILIVEDEEAIRLLLKRVVEQMGHEVVTAEDGPSALAQVGARAPHLILTDLSLPGMPFGVELVRAFRAAVPACPIIVSTGDASDARIQELTEAGVEHVLSKPFDIPAVRALIESILDKRAR